MHLIFKSIVLSKLCHYLNHLFCDYIQKWDSERFDYIQKWASERFGYIPKWDLRTLPLYSEMGPPSSSIIFNNDSIILKNHSGILLQNSRLF